MARNNRWLLVMSCVGMFFFSAATAWAAPAVTAKSAIVLDALTGEVLYAREAETRRYPASTTKMMTLLVALEYGRLEDEVVASETAAQTEGSSLYLEKGERQTLRNLLYGVMLVSGNDATVAVAEHIAGSVESYARLMTAKALEIGAVDTHFVNSSGLPDPAHYTTAHDLARIAAYGYRTQPLFAEIVAAKRHVLPWPGKEYPREIFNENRMLWLYEGGNGVKTGYTDAAGRCLVSAAKRDGLQLIAVVLDSERMWDDSMALLDYGFAQTRPKLLAPQGKQAAVVAVQDGTLRELPLVLDRDVVVPEGRDSATGYSLAVEAPQAVAAPVRQGEVLGQLRVLRGGAEVASLPLRAAQEVERRSLLRSLGLSLQDVWSWMKVAFLRLWPEGMRA